MLQFRSGVSLAVLVGACVIAADFSHAQEPQAKPPAASGDATVTVESRAESSNSSDAADPAGNKKAYRGRIVIIGPDGKRQEIEFGNPDGVAAPPAPIVVPPQVLLQDGAIIWGKPSGASVFAFTTTDVDAAKSKMIIGVSCSDAGDALRSHLKLEGVGVVVDVVMEKSPAEAAGIQVHDILLKAADIELKSAEDLVSAVEKSADQPLSVELLRAGERMTIAITPVLQAEVRFATDDHAAWGQWLNMIHHREAHGEVFFDARTVGPGALLPPTVATDPARLDRLEAELRSLSDKIDALIEKTDGRQK